MKICEPAKAYLVILVVYFIVKALYKAVTVQTSVIDLVVALFWTWILSILCRKGMKELAWALVLLPFVMMGSTFIYGGRVFREGALSQNVKNVVMKVSNNLTKQINGLAIIQDNCVPDPENPESICQNHIDDVIDNLKEDQFLLGNILK